LEAAVDGNVLSDQGLDLFLFQVVTMHGHGMGHGTGKQLGQDLLPPLQRQVIPEVDPIV
jgi:hypothetical protein